MTPPSPAEVRSILETDRAWCAYALADLEPAYAASCEWLVGERSVVLIFSGLTPPVLFAHGPAQEVATILARVPPGDYQYGLLGTDRADLRHRLRPSSEKRMWRMAFKAADFEPGAAEGAERLGASQLQEMLALFDNHPDRPDAFHERQVEDGAFFGARVAGELVSVAGTHVIAHGPSVAAIGNVFTRPEARGQGLATRVTAAVAAELLARGLRTIVLNVAMDNEPALQCYRRLGFWPYVSYYEGVGRLV